VRKDETLPYLRPDGKSQVTVEYRNGTAERVDCVVIGAQHDPDVSHDKIEADIIKHVIEPIIPASLMDGDTKHYVNATGRFVPMPPATSPRTWSPPGWRRGRRCR